MDRVSQGRATLDVVRAAQRLAGTGLSRHSPVGLHGLLPGRRRRGGGRRAGLDLRPRPPAQGRRGRRRARRPGQGRHDPRRRALLRVRVLRAARASASYDVDLSPYLNADGRRDDATGSSRTASSTCSTTPSCSPSTLSADGQPMSDADGAASRSRSIIEAQRIGTIKPTVPVLVTHSALDDVIPYAVGKAMAKSWCGKGANVYFSTNLAPLPRGRHRAARRPRRCRSSRPASPGCRSSATAG